jgi:hypothetical protein
MESGNVHGGVLVVAQWEAKEDESDKIAKILALSFARRIAGRADQSNGERHG